MFQSHMREEQYLLLLSESLPCAVAGCLRQGMAGLSMTGHVVDAVVGCPAHFQDGSIFEVDTQLRMARVGAYDASLD